MTAGWSLEPLTAEPGANSHKAEGEEQEVVVPEHEGREEAQEGEHGPRVERPVKHERNPLSAPRNETQSACSVPD